MPSVRLTSPAAGAPFTAPATVQLVADASDSNGTVQRVDFFADGAFIGSDTTGSAGSYSKTWLNAPAGTYLLTAEAVDDADATTTSAPVQIVVAGSTGGGGTATATFLRTDSATQGSWKTVYGADGFNVIGDAVRYPAYAIVTKTALQAVWRNPTTEIRALQKADSDQRIAGLWHRAPFTVDIGLQDDDAHDVAVYVLDWDRRNRVQTIEVLDAITREVPGEPEVSEFGDGRGSSCGGCKGHVILRVSGASVMSGLFLLHALGGSRRGRPVVSADPVVPS